MIVGVLYHLRNPYSVVEKLGPLCDHLILGIWVADCLPDRSRIIGDDQVVFKLQDRQLAGDPTNYWIFTARSARVLVERSVVNPTHEQPDPPRLRSGSQPLGNSPPDNVEQRMFMLLERAGGE